MRRRALLALKDRWLLAAVLIGLAVANKPWAVVAVIPVAAAARRAAPARLVVAGAVAAVVLAPILLARRAVAADDRRDGALGGADLPALAGLLVPRRARPGRHRRFGEKPGYRAAPAWAGPISHPLVVLAAVAVALAWWRRRGGHPATARTDALLLLALVLLLRSLLDTWSIGYYHLPFLLALTAWEVQARRGLPLVARGHRPAVDDDRPPGPLRLARRAGRRLPGLGGPALARPAARAAPLRASGNDARSSLGSELSTS